MAAIDNLKAYMRLKSLAWLEANLIPIADNALTNNLQAVSIATGGHSIDREIAYPIDEFLGALSQILNEKDPVKYPLPVGNRILHADFSYGRIET